MAFDLATAKPAGFDLSTARPVGEQPKVPRETPDTGGMSRYLEPIATLGSGALAEVLGGVAGIAGTVLPGEEFQGERWLDATRDALTYEPVTPAGQEGLAAVAETVAPVTDAISGAETALGDFAFDLTGSPAVAAGATAAPAALMEVLGLGLARKMRGGTRLIDDAGDPTKALEKALDQKGLSYEGLSSAAKRDIPLVAPKGIIPGGKDVAGPVENALIAQIQSGATDGGLAKIKVQGGRVTPDDLGVEAVKQGFPEGFVQSVKVASPETRQGMDKILKMRQRIKGNERLALDFRPSDVVGDSVNKRISYIQNSAAKARNELNDIAERTLPGQRVSSARIDEQLRSSLDDLDIDLIENNGKISPEFTGSMISKDRTSQRVIRDLVDLLGETETPDALRLHKLKRQLDTMIDFRKKSPGGLTDAGKNVLKNVRFSINETLRELNPDYARVNDVLHKSLTAMDDFKKVAGPSIDISAEGSSKAIGQDLRGLMSNRKSRVRLENAVNQLDSTAAELGANFGDDVKTLTQFVEGVEDRFGTVAGTSFEGEIGSAVNRTLNQGVKDTVRQAVIEKAGKGVEQLRGINDVNAFRAMRQLINQRR